MTPNVVKTGDQGMERHMTGKPAHERYFRWRGGDITRLEGFSDAVFAFAVTLLVVSLEVPKTFAELADAMRGFIAFALSFAFLVWVWYAHFVYFRRYALEDRYTIVLNALLLFTVLFYVYPLKFLAGIMVDQILYGRETVLVGGSLVRVIEPAEGPILMAIYSTRFVAVFAVLVLMYVLAWRVRGVLGLSPLEAFDTKARIWSYGSVAFVGLLSLSVLAAGGER